MSWDTFIYIAAVIGAIATIIGVPVAVFKGFRPSSSGGIPLLQR